MSVNDITSADLSMFDTGYRMLGAGARGRSREMISGGRWEEGSGLGTHIHPWWIHVNVWQNQYSIVKQNKVKKKKNPLAMQWFDSGSIPELEDLLEKL